MNTHPKFVSETEDNVLSFQQCKLLMVIAQLLCWRVMETARIEVRDNKIALIKEDEKLSTMKTLQPFC